METVISKDGTSIAFDRLGEGPAVILVSGGSVDRQSNAGVASDPRVGLHGLQLRPPRSRPKRRHCAIRDRAGSRGHRRSRGRGRRVRLPVWVVLRRSPRPDRGGAAPRQDHEAGHVGAPVHPRSDRSATGRPGRAVQHDAGRGSPRRRGPVLHGEGRRHAGRIRCRCTEPAVVGRKRGSRPHLAVRRDDHGRLLAADRTGGGGDDPDDRPRRRGELRVHGPDRRGPGQGPPRGQRVTLAGQEHNIDPNVLAPALKEFYAG